MPAHRIHPVVERKCDVCGTTFFPQPCDVAKGMGRYCGRTCSGIGRRRSHKTLESRFREKVTKTDDCWLWTGATNGVGYGLIGIGHRDRKRHNALAHRVSYELHIGPIPDGLFVCHRCDNPSCVRPDHLFLGNTQENAQDMVSKERHPSKNLSSDDVRTILERYAAGIPVSQLAKEHGVNLSAIYRVIRGQTFPHITK